MLTTTDLMLHLVPDATWTQLQEAGDRMRAVYSKDAAARQAAIVGEAKVHLGGVQVRMDNRVGHKGAYRIGLDHAFSMGRAMMVHRQLARQRDHNRDHYIKNALRIRRALCYCGLSLAPMSRLELACQKK